MKIVITGSLGNVGKPLIEKLVQKGHSIIVISRNINSREEIEKIGATAAIGSVKDVSFLKRAFTGADTVFCMIPPDYSTPDQIEHYRSIAENYAEAIKGTGIKKIVHLSSWGADLDKGTGYILGSYHSENILNTISDVAITHLRAGYLYYNLFGFIDLIKQTGIIASVYGGEDKIMMTAPIDIAIVATEELTDINKGINVRYIASDDRTANDVAHVLGKVIDKPELQWKTLTSEEMRGIMQGNGVPEHTIENILALGESIHKGSLRRDYDKTDARLIGKVRIEDFAKDFAFVYNKS